MNADRIKLIFKHLLGRDLYIRPKIRIDLEHHGNRYGDWSVPDNYVTKDSVIYSFGIGEDASWDLGLISAHGCNVHGFDPTPKSLAWTSRHVNDARFVMHPWALATEDGNLDLWLPKNSQHVSASCRPSSNTSQEKITVPCFSLPTIMNRLGHQRIDVLKMDIEGTEYSVLASLLRDESLMEKIGVLLVEFHHWMSSFDLDDTRRAIALLEENHYVPAWVSETGHEILFVRR